MPRFFTNDNLSATLCSVHIQLHQIIASFLTDVESRKIDVMAIHGTHIDQLLSFIGNLNKIISICNVFYCRATARYKILHEQHSTSYTLRKLFITF